MQKSYRLRQFSHILQKDVAHTHWLWYQQLVLDPFREYEKTMLIYIVLNVANEVVLVCNELVDLLAHLTTAPHHEVQVWNVTTKKKVGGTLAANPEQVIQM